MSTKSTIAHGEGFHFYNECFDFEDGVYLELNKADFELHKGKTVVVRVPLDIWETIRRTEPYNFDLAGLSDEELLARVAKEVDERIARYEQDVCDHPEANRALLLWIGAGVYGGADEPRDSQIERGMKWYQEQREFQRGILAKMRTYEITNGAVFGFNFNAGTCELMAGEVKDGAGNVVATEGAVKA